MIDDVLAELAAAGTVESEGEFTMDRAKAREKLQRFQLADPREYVLELVQAAGLKGATWATFTVDSRDMVMELDGRPFTTADFDDIYGAALSRRTDPDVLARRQLAIGLGSAMALRPRFIAVESGDGKTGARLQLEPDEEDVFEAIETARVGTRIHVRERFTMGTFAAFFKNLSGTLAEEQLLRARCTYASFGIGLEGVRLDRGLTLDDELVLDVVEVQEGPTRAVCGLRKDGAGSATVRLVKDGVWIVDHELPTARFPAGFFAVAQDHALRKDVSQSDIVRDEAYEAMLGVLGRGCRRALASLCERTLTMAAPPWAELELLRQLNELAREGVVCNDEPTGLVKALRRLPLWSTTDGVSRCLDELLGENDANGSVGYTSSEKFGGIAVPGRSFVVQLPTPSPPDLHRRILAHVFGTRLHDVTPKLEELLRREQARRFWRARATMPVLPEGAYLCRRTLAGPGVRGELGIVAAQTDRVSLALVVDGCMLVEQPLPLPWLGLRMVVEADALQPDASFENIVPSRDAYTALLHAAAAIPSLYAELAHVAPGTAWRDACAMSFLESALRGDSLALVLGGRTGAEHEAAVAAATEAFGAARLRLDPGLQTNEPHPTVGMPLWRTLRPRRFSLQELLARARAGDPIMAVGEVTPGIQADILVLDLEERGLLQPLLARPLVDGKKEVTRLLRERTFLSRAVARPELDAGPPAVRVPIEGKGITGMLQVEPTAGMGRRTIEVLYRQRPLDRVSLVMVGECKGWVESTEVEPTADYRAAKESEALDRAREAVLRAFAAACLQIAARSQASASPYYPAFLLEVLGLAFPGAYLRAAYDKLRSAKDAKEVSPERVSELYQRLYAAMHLEADSTVSEGRVMRLSRSKTPAADAAAIAAPNRPHAWATAAVDVLFPPGDTPHDLTQRVLRPVAPLAELPLWRRHDGQPLALAAIREVVERKETLLHTDERVDLSFGERTMVLVDPGQLPVLRRIVDRQRLLDGRGLIAEARRRQELDARAKVDRVVLPPGAARVSVRLEGDKGRRGLEGEVGLAAHHPGDPHRKPLLRLATYVERAAIEVVELQDQPAYVVAAANDDRLQLTPDHKGVARNKILDNLALQCLARVPDLMTLLAAQWAALEPAARKVAWLHVIDFLVANRPATLDAWATKSGAFAKAAAVPGFVGAGGVPLSAAQLVQAHLRNERVDVLPAPHTMWGDSPLPPERPVVCADAYELDALQWLLPQVESVEAPWSQWQERARRRDAAPRASTLPDARVLVAQEIVTSELQGRLVIPVAGIPLTIELCAEGRVIAARSLPGVLPCWGSLTGLSVQPDQRWADAIIDPAALQALRLRSLKLYGKLARWLSANEEHPEEGRVASLLAEQVVALRQAERRGPLPDSTARLLDDLRWARVLALPNGRRINLHKALEEQPGELAHLDLWDARAHRLQRMYAEAEASVGPPVDVSTLVPPVVDASAPLDAPRLMRTRTLEPPPASPPAPQAAAPVLQPATPVPQPPAPAPREPTPEERLVDALRAELGLVRARNESLLSNEHLDRIRVGPLSGGAGGLVARADRQGVTVNRDHPVVRRALAAHAGDPVWCSYVASAVYTALNVWLAEVTDADERTFLELHAGLAAGR